MEKLYKKIGWKNRPNASTPLGATNLKKIDEALDGLDNRTIELDTQRANHKRLIDDLYFKTDALEKEIEEVRTETNSSIDALKIVPTASGSPVYIFDASNMGFEGIDFFGESKQRQTTGKNLFGFEKSAIDVTEELRKLDNQRLIFTKINDNSIKCNYSWGTYATGFVELNGVDGTKNYAFSFDVKNNKLGFTPRIEKYTQECTSEKLVLSIYSGSGATEVSGNEYFILENIQVEEGTTATSFEPYTGGKASPSSDYLQPIESKIVNQVVVSNAQLLDLIANTNQATTNGMVISVESGYILTVKGTSSKAWSNLTDFAEIDIPSGKYTFSVDAVPSGLNGIGIKFRKSIEDSTNVTHVITGSKKSITLDYLDDFKLVQIYADGCNTSTNYNFTIKVMLNAGETALPFEQHQSQTVNLSAPIELNGFGGVRDTIEIYADGSGKHIQRVGKMYTRNVPAVYTSSLKNPNGNVYILTVSSWEKEILWTHRNKGQSVSTLTKDQYYVGQNESVASSKVIYFISDATTTASALAEIQAENSEIYYVLLNPIETALPQADIDAIKNLHTYKPNTVVMNDADAEMDVHYVADAKTYIDKKFEALASAIVNQ